MELETVRRMVAELEAESASLDGEVAALIGQLEGKRERLGVVREARAALSKLLPELGEPRAGAPEPKVIDRDDSAEASRPRQEDSSSLPAMHPEMSTSGDPGRVRIRSTSLVAAVVGASPVPMTRDQIRDQFRQRGLIPATWKNPDNAIGNAIARAAERGDIRALPDGRFAAVDLPLPMGSGHVDAEAS